MLFWYWETGIWSHPSQHITCNKNNIWAYPGPTFSIFGPKFGAKIQNFNKNREVIIVKLGDMCISHHIHLERVQYKAVLIVSGCWQGSSRERLCEELGWESLSDRRWARRLTIFYKINNGLAPSYLSNHIPQRNEISVNLRSRVDSTPLHQNWQVWKQFFIRILWKELGDDFQKHLNDFIRPLGHSLFGICDKYWAKLLTKIRVSFSDLRGHRFNHNLNCDNPL